MSIKRSTNLIAIGISIVLLSYHIGAYNRISKTNSKGMHITVIQDKSFRYFNAEIVFELRRVMNSAIPIITTRNLLDINLPNQNSPLISNLSKIGYNCQFHFHQNSIRISLQFLPSQLEIFMDFLKDLYSYKHFKPERFTKSKQVFWQKYYSDPNWLEQFVTQVAYNRMFKDNIIARSPISAFDVKNASFYQLLSYYHEIFRPSRTKLYIKGKTNPHVVYGHIENALRSLKDKPERALRQKRASIIPGKQIIVIDNPKQRTPVIFTFRTIPPVISRKHIPEVLTNTIYFGVPSGRIYRAAINGGVGNITVDSDTSNYRYFSVIRNKIQKLQISELEYFLNIAINIPKPSGSFRPGREEFLRAVKVFLGEKSVKTSKYNNDLELEIKRNRFFNDIPSFTQIPPNPGIPTSYLTLSKGESNNKNQRAEVYIIVGKLNRIIKHIKKFNPVLLKLPNY